MAETQYSPSSGIGPQREFAAAQQSDSSLEYSGLYMLAADAYRDPTLHLARQVPIPVGASRTSRRSERAVLELAFACGDIAGDGSALC